MYRQSTPSWSAIRAVKPSYTPGQERNLLGSASMLLSFSTAVIFLSACPALMDPMFPSLLRSGSIDGNNAYEDNDGPTLSCIWATCSFSMSKATRLISIVFSSRPKTTRRYARRPHFCPLSIGVLRIHCGGPQEVRLPPRMVDQMRQR
jgi:hypothetical protein